MTAFNPKAYYSRFLEGHKGKLHFAAHSHHFWPDVSREGHLKYWDDCAKSSDEKWNKIFVEVIPETQKHIANILHVKDPKQIALAPNTHELAARLLSCFLGSPSLSVLTTTSEFHSWRRQLLRLMEEKNVHVTMVPSSDLLHERRIFMENLKTELQKSPDLFFISQVFFDSGIALSEHELIELYEAKSSHTIMVVDGYHGFAAVPTDLSKLEGKIFYLAGGYKYAQGGEGMGFMVIPKGDWRPAYTGWFAEYAELSMPAHGKVGYSDDFMAFMGATQDPSGWYRFNATWEHFKSEGITVPKIHSYVKDLQLSFIQHLDPDFLKIWGLKALFKEELINHGHFLTFEASSVEMAMTCEESLKKAQILIDRRGPRLRFGFGLYQDLSDVVKLSERLKRIS